MVFPTDPQRLPRHPSQLYEAFGEGVLLFMLLWFLERLSVKKGWYRPGLLSGTFLVGYGIVRFLIEFTRQPDAQRVQPVRDARTDDPAPSTSLGPVGAPGPPSKFCGRDAA